MTPAPTRRSERCEIPGCTNPRGHKGACSDGIDHNTEPRLMGPCEVCGVNGPDVMAAAVSVGDHYLGVMRVCRDKAFSPAHPREDCRAALVKRWIREGITL